jgi:Uncharacterized protein conserved in bacteria (DUF2184)
MDRRGFLRLLGGAVAVSATTYVLPPLGGWRREQSGLYANNGCCVSPNWAHKTPEEIMADVNAMLTATWERSAELEWPNFIGVSALGIKRLAKTPNEEFLAYSPRGSKSIKAMLTVQNRKVTDVQLYGV